MKPSKDTATECKLNPSLGSLLPEVSTQEPCMSKAENGVSRTPAGLQLHGLRILIITSGLSRCFEYPVKRY